MRPWGAFVWLVLGAGSGCATSLQLFETYVFGRNAVGRPAVMNWQLVAEDRHGMGGRAVTKTVKLYFSEKRDGPSMEVALTLPVSGKRVPVFLIAGNERLNPMPVLERGYGLVACRVDQIQADAPNGYAKSIRGFFAAPGQTEPGPEEWGAVGAWAWGLSRAMDYLETDPDVDAKRVGLNGAWRYAKVALWAGAEDARFAMTIAQDASLAVTAAQMAKGRASYWLDRKLQDYRGDVGDFAWAELVGLHAPRPVYIATAEETGEAETKAAWAAAKGAEKAYAAAGKGGVGDFIGYHTRPGDHLQNQDDWHQYLKFADRHFGITRK